MGGVLIATAGIEAVFILSVCLYLAGIAATLSLKHYKHVAPAVHTPVLSRIAEGLREVRARRRLLGIYVITALYNIFGWPCYSLIPVIGKDNLGLGPEGIGLLSSTDGVGAMVGALWVILLARPSHYHAVYVGSVAVFNLMMIGFALMSGPLLAGGFLFLAGVVGTCFGVMQTTLIYRAVTPEMRSRMLGLLSVSIGVGPIGFLQVGVLAELLGARTAIVVIALEGLVALALTFPLWRRGSEPDQAAG